MTRIAIIRPERRLRESKELAEEMGFDVMCASSLDVIPADDHDFEIIRELISEDEFDIIIFASPTAVEECARAWNDLDVMLKGQIVPMGSGTSASLKKCNVTPVLTPNEFSSDGVVSFLGSSVSGMSVLIVRSDQGSDVMRDGLESNGAKVSEFFAYRLTPSAPAPEIKEMIDAGEKGEIDVFMFTSPLSARSFVDSSISEVGERRTTEMLSRSSVSAIGAPTAYELRSMGISVDIVPKRATFADMLNEIRETKEMKK